MNERIQEIIDSEKIKKIDFARRIGVSGPFVSEMCSGAKSPSDRTIADICREFNVNETWLRTGEGPMYRPRTRDQELAALMGSILRDEDDSFRKAFITALCRLDEPAWEQIEKFARTLLEGLDKKEGQG